MSVALDHQLHEYCRQLDEQQGALAVDDILERTGVLPTLRPARRRLTPRRVWWTAAAVVGLVGALGIGLRFFPGTGGPLQPADRPNTTMVVPRTDFPERGPVEAGTYRLGPSESLVTGVTLTLPEGWATDYGLPYAIKAPAEEAYFEFSTVDAVSSDPCERPDGTAVGPSVDDLVQALVEMPGTTATGPVDTTIGGLPAKRVDLTVAEGVDATGCNAPGGLQIWYSRPSDSYFVVLQDDTASVYILDIDGGRQVFVTQYQSGFPADVATETQAIIDSIEFD